MYHVSLIQEAVLKKNIILNADRQCLSMAPLIARIAQLEITNVKNIGELEVGDIIVMDFLNQIVCHRIVKINKNNIITKGDNNHDFDLPITFDRIIGKLERILFAKYSIDLKTNKSKRINRIMSRISIHCSMKKNVYTTEIVFCLLRIIMILFSRMYTRNKKIIMVGE